MWRLPHFLGLVRFIPKSTTSTSTTTSSSSEALIGEPCDPSQDVGLASYNAEPIHVETFTGTSILNPGQRTGEKVQVERILSPLSEREVGTIRCIGLNVSFGSTRSLLCSSRRCAVLCTDILPLARWFVARCLIVYQPRERGQYGHPDGPYVVHVSPGAVSVQSSPDDLAKRLASPESIS
jgi:hypothetical protein